MLFLLYNQATGNLTKSCPSTSSREVGPRDTSAWGLGRTAGWQALPSADLHPHTSISTYLQSPSFSPGLGFLIYKMDFAGEPTS